MNTLEITHKKGTVLDGMGTSLMALLIGLVLMLCLAPCALAHSDADTTPSSCEPGVAHEYARR